MFKKVEVMGVVSCYGEWDLLDVGRVEQLSCGNNGQLWLVVNALWASIDSCQCVAVN